MTYSCCQHYEELTYRDAVDSAAVVSE